MTSILDIVPVGKEVPLAGDQKATVFGLSVKDIATLVGKYPELKSLIGGRKAFSLTPELLLETAPDAAAHALCLGFGADPDGPDFASELAAAANLPAGYQIPLLWAIIEETVGVTTDGPFVAKLMALVNQLEAAAGGKGPGGTSSKRAKS